MPPGCSAACCDQRRRRRTAARRRRSWPSCWRIGAAAAVEVEQREAVVLRVDLRVVAARRRGRRRPAPASCAVSPGVDSSRANTLADERLGRRVRRVVDDQAAVAEHRFDPAAERVGHADARRVGAPQVGHAATRGIRWGAAAVRARRGRRRCDRRARRWRPAPARRRAAPAATTVRGVERRRRTPYTTGLRPSRDPRRRSRRPRRPARCARATTCSASLMRGQRLEQREQRAAEEPGLLAGDDGDRAADRRAARPARARAAARRGAPAARAMTAAISSRRRSCACVARDRVGPRARGPPDCRKKTARPTESRTRSRRRAAGSTESAGRRPESARKAVWRS